MENIAHNKVIHRLVKIGDQIRSEHEKSALKKKGDYFFFPHLNWFSQEFPLSFLFALPCTCNAYIFFIESNIARIKPF
jgi:hypothetical protein